jgi:hypothetical protein
MTTLRVGGAGTTTAYTTGGGTDKSCAGSIAAHPCKKRKDGAPSVGMVHAKMGHPPLSRNVNLDALMHMCQMHNHHFLSGFTRLETQVFSQASKIADGRHPSPQGRQKLAPGVRVCYETLVGTKK